MPTARWKKKQRPTHRSDENVHTTQLTRDQRNKKENPREWVEIGGDVDEKNTRPSEQDRTSRPKKKTFERDIPSPYINDTYE